MAMSYAEMESAAEQTANFLSASPEDEPELTLQWIRAQMSQE